MLPRGRIRTSQPGSNTALSSTQYPQQYYQENYNPGSFPSSSNAPWPRARGFELYTDYCSPSNNRAKVIPNQYTTGPYSGGMGRGGGLIDAAIRQPPDHRTPDNRQKPKKPRYQNRNNIQEREIRSDKKNKCKPGIQEKEAKETGHIMHMCPKCECRYNAHLSQRAGSRIPLILNCGHTMCQECIYQGFTKNKINCPKCSKDSTLTREQYPIYPADLQNVFIPNFYIIGILSYDHVTGGSMKKLENLSFVGAGFKKPPKAEPSPTPADSCCFGDCRRKATMFCSSCEGFYCSDCCTVIHKSAKQLMSHVPEPIREKRFSFMLENCVEHPKMLVEFFCETCDLGACCYCVLDKHADHERVVLYSLNDAEMKEFKKRKKLAEKILKEIHVAQKKASKLANFDTSEIKKEVLHYFSDYHAKLECLEKKVFNELENFKLSNSGLSNIQSSLQKHAEELEQLVCFNEDNIGKKIKKVNLRGAFKKLLTIGDIPRFLLNKSDQAKPISFVANYNNLDDEIFIKKTEDYEYQLVAENNLPADFAIENEADNETDEKRNSPVNTADVLTENSAGSSGSTKRKSVYRQSMSARKYSGLERVEVQHINSLESFFIQFKKDQSKLSLLNEEIESYVKMGGAESVEDPKINDLYLALYISGSQDNKEQKWCRARLTEIRVEEGTDTELYEMFLIDYGKVQVVGRNRIRDIPVSFSQKKAFAIECMLHNPMDVTWKKDAHYSLAKILIDKDVVMMEKGYSHGICEVDLMIASSDGGTTSVSDILIHAHHSVANSNEDSPSLDGSQSSNKEVYYSPLKIFPNSITFTKNQKERVKIVNVVDPYNIFVHMVKNEDAIQNMNREIKKAYKSHNTGACAPIEGSYAIVEYRGFMKTNWHRALIKSVDYNIDTVHVLLVDWGINVVVSSNKIKPLQKCITKIESQAVLIKLAHIAPNNMQSVWASNATNFLQTFQRSQDVLKMIVQDVTPDVEVALFDMHSNVDMCLNAMMVEHNLADSTGYISEKVEWPRFEADNAEFSTEDGLMSSLLKKVDEEAKIDDDSDEEDLSGIAKKRVDVVKVESPELIWMKFLHFKDRERQMFKNLQVHYSQDRQVQSEWQVGEFCVTELGPEYVRGKILEQVRNGYKIYLFDKAQDITVSIDKIYKYDEYFGRYQQTVVKCHLANIRPAGDTGNWSISSIEALQEIIRKQHRLYAAMVNNEAPDDSKSSLAIDMWYGLIIRGGPLDPDKIKYVSVANSLVKLGFAFRLNKTTATTYTAQEALLKGIANIQMETFVKQPLKMDTSEQTSPSMPETSKKSWSEEIMEAEESPNSNSSNVVLQNDSMQSEKLSDTDELSENDEENNSADGDWTCNKAEVEIHDWLPAFKITEREFQARVTCVESGGHLYIHTEPLEEAYCKMEANIKKYFDANLPVITDQRWQPGDLCTIKFSDEKWYRGKVLNMINRDEVCVYMIDFGSDHDVPRDTIFREVLYTEIRAFATKLKLDRVFAKSGSWLTSDYDHFHGLVTNWCKIVVKGSLDVELPLVDVYNDQDILVNQRLTEICPNLSRSSNIPDESVEDENGIIIEHIEIEEAYSNKEANDGSELTKVINIGSTNGNQNLKYKVQNLPQELVDGEKISMAICGIMDYNRVCVRTEDSNTSEEIYHLFNAIQDNVHSFPSLKDYAIGSPCIGKYSEDESWYRAQIIGNETDNTRLVDVLFVDYGNHEPVAKDNIKSIRPEDMQIPQQCWEVGLNVVLADGADSSSVKELLKTFDKKNVYVKLVTNNPVIVDLYEETGDLLYNKMIKSGILKPLYT